jgi:hypothetical protein
VLLRLLLLFCSSSQIRCSSPALNSHRLPFFTALPFFSLFGCCVSFFLSAMKCKVSVICESPIFLVGWWVLRFLCFEEEQWALLFWWGVLSLAISLTSFVEGF